MLGFFLYSLSFLGLGRVLLLSLERFSSSEENRNLISKNGIALFLGSLTLPILLFFLQAVFPLGISSLSRIALVLCLAGFIISEFKIFKLKGLEAYLHPIYFLFVCLLGVFLTSEKIIYGPFHWDEFSHWVIIPKQIFLFDQLDLTRFVWTTTSDYTPGWALLITYPLSLLQKGFDLSQVVSLPLLYGLGISVLIYDFMEISLKKYVTDENKNIFFLLLLVFYFVMLISPFYKSFFTHDLLIEHPIKVAGVGFSLMFLFWEEKAFSRFQLLLMLSLTIAGGYLIRRTFLTAVPVVIGIVLVSNFFESFSSRDWKKIILSSVKDLALCLACFLISGIIWNNEIAHLVESYSFTANGLDAFKILLDEIKIAWVFILELFKLPLFKKFLYFSSFFILGFSFYRKKKRYFVLAIILMNLLYFGGLFWAYAIHYDFERAMRGVGFLRRFSPSIFLTIISSYTLLFYEILEFLLKNEKLKVLLTKKPTKVILVIVLITSSLRSARVLQKQIHKMTGREQTDIVAQETKKLNFYIRDTLKAKDLKVSLFREGDNGFAYVLAKYESLFDKNSPYFNLDNENRTNQWLGKAKLTSVRNQFKKSHIIWTVGDTTRIDEILGSFVESGTCEGAYSKYFLVRNSMLGKENSEKFSCILKESL